MSETVNNCGYKVTKYKEMDKEIIKVEKEQQKGFKKKTGTEEMKRKKQKEDTKRETRKDKGN